MHDYWQWQIDVTGDLAPSWSPLSASGLYQPSGLEGVNQIKFNDGGNVNISKIIIYRSAVAAETYDLTAGLTNEYSFQPLAEGDRITLYASDIAHLALVVPTTPVVELKISTNGNDFQWQSESSTGPHSEFKDRGSGDSSEESTDFLGVTQINFIPNMLSNSNFDITTVGHELAEVFFMTKDNINPVKSMALNGVEKIFLDAPLKAGDSFIIVWNDGISVDLIALAV